MFADAVWRFSEGVNARWYDGGKSDKKRIAQAQGQAILRGNVHIGLKKTIILIIEYISILRDNLI